VDITLVPHRHGSESTGLHSVGGVAYSAAKAAQLSFARALAREVGRDGVTVNCVAPGLIDTDITSGGCQKNAKRSWSLARRLAG
jgi:NAD(P)-dependent dehydrogenase (short-subunit alcohol dehydrogenase family)